MPIYVYKFVDTGETIEVEQAFTDDTLTEYPHPEGGKPMPVKKVFQPVGVTFKGSGFYKTDSRASRSSGTAAKSDNGASSNTSDAKASDTPPKTSSKSDSGSTASKSTAGSTTSDG